MSELTHSKMMPVFSASVEGSNDMIAGMYKANPADGYRVGLKGRTHVTIPVGNLPDDALLGILVADPSEPTDMTIIEAGIDGGGDGYLVSYTNTDKVATVQASSLQEVYVFYHGSGAVAPIDLYPTEWR